MTNVRTLRFHTDYGPVALFEKASEKLNDLAGLSLGIPHAQARLEEREVPQHLLTDFQPEFWELVVVETSVSAGRISYMSLRRQIESNEYLWIVLAHEHVITAWITERAGNRSTHPLIVKDGPAWDAAAAGQEPAITAAMAGWADAYFRRVRAHRVLAALSAAPDRQSGDRLAMAAHLVMEGRTWKEAALESGWRGKAPLDAAIARLLRAVKRTAHLER
ncbi:hypothetical protein QWI29_06000 [Mycolicibacterium neoaurum]|uniref:hypothetical protein n=1 Tax=Mycolicibacterium neoaurum TaxID=1795 RepID=UPI002672B4D6|nr:hypothetical protein [Mycolicibacterium neoaurum]MDO3399579.1 hypothetical protein [Mycolicibacterium neoaurum]